MGNIFANGRLPADITPRSLTSPSRILGFRVRTGGKRNAIRLLSVIKALASAIGVKIVDV